MIELIIMWFNEGLNDCPVRTSTSRIARINCTAGGQVSPMSQVLTSHHSLGFGECNCV